MSVLLFSLFIVIGNKLEEKMLSLFILALRTHFSLPDEWGIVQQYLQSFTKLPRFSFVNMMLDKTTKRGRHFDLVAL